jgi:transposase-like protein
VEFKNDDKAREYLERLRWPNGVVCPHCGTIGEHYQLEGKAHRSGLWKCREKDCREQFSVTVGTVFERSHVPLSKWLLAVHLMCSSEKGMSAHHLHRSLWVTYRTAWFMAHRIREAMKGGGGLMGGSGEMVFSLVERGGNVRSVHITGKMFDEMKAHLHGNIAPETRLMTDEARMYRKVAQRFAEHQSVNHSKDEYVRGEAHTNTIEGFFSVFKRGMNGVYQHCGSQHLHRYLTEFYFRYNHRVSAGYDDVQQAAAALMGIGGKRLMYRDSSGG